VSADRWDGGGDYEAYVGRWSRRVAEGFVAALDAPEGAAWLDVGCGTGALTATIAAHAAPASVAAIDRSPEFVAHASAQLADRRVVFLVGDAAELPLTPARIDVVVSGLLLNFLPDPQGAVAELRRVARPGATIAAYVWDYAEGMEPIRAFWDAAIELDPGARAGDEALRFPLCTPSGLRGLFAGAGLDSVRTWTIDVAAAFDGFDDYWTPFLSGVGPAPGYCAGLPDDRRAALRDLLRERLSPAGDDPFSMNARAFAVRGTVPDDGTPG
jgi:SAM-dependent methyltransferase